MAERYGRKIIQIKAALSYSYYPADSSSAGLRLIPKEVPKASAPVPEVVLEPQALPEPPPIIEEPKEALERRDANEYLILAQNLLAKGDYEGSLRKVKGC